jgi:hypothetical protein
MNTIQIIEPKELYKPAIGDVLWGAAADWSSCNPKDPMRIAGRSLNVLDGHEIESEIIYLPCIAPNFIAALKTLNIDSQFFIDISHEEPYTGFRVFPIAAIAVLTDNTGKYRETLESWGRCDCGYALDSEWHKQMHKERVLDISEITRLMMGTGYTCGCSINDGSRKIKPAKLLLSNNDWLYVNFWEWYNK